MKTQPVSFTQPAPISMSGATLPGAGTRVRSRTPRRTRPRTRAIGWPWKIQPPIPKVMPSVTAASAVSRSTILPEDLVVAMAQPRSMWRATTRRWIWLVPSKIWLILASRMKRSTGKSRM